MRKLSVRFPRSIGSRILLLFAIVVVALAALAYSPAPDFAKMHRPNPHETFYQYVAFEFDAPALCDKLSPSALIPGGFFIAPSYARSDCYDTIARRYDRPALCWRARRLGSFAPLEEQTSIATCFWDVFQRAPDRSISTYMPGRNDVVTIFAEMGYRPEELYREGVTPPLLNLPDAYRRLAAQPDLVQRIDRITSASLPPASPAPPAPLTDVGPSPASPTESTPLTSTERMYLFELAAHVSGDVSWCTRIPADLRSPGTPRNTRGPSLFERDRCILEIATNTRTPASCQLIPVRPDDWPGPMSRRSVCEQQAARPPDKYHYGAIPPQTDAQTRQLITLLGYPLPGVHDVSANEIESGYYYFIWQLARGEPITNTRASRADPASISARAAVAAARAKFLARVAALPSYQ
jgi:hypothetical protein